MKSLLLPMVLLFPSLGLVAGCRGQAIDDRAQREIASIHDDTTSLLIEASCPDGAVLHAECGLVSQRVAMPDFRETFTAKKCTDDTTQVCQEKFDQAVNTWMGQRYPLADIGAVEAACEAHPERCDDPKVYEQLLMSSHNNALSRIDWHRTSDAVARREMRHAIDDAQTTDDVLLGVAVVGLALATPHHHHHW